MKKWLIIALILSSTVLSARCIKCEILKEHHKLNPCQFEYYEDYLKACEEQGIKPEEIDLEEEVRKKENITYPSE